MNKHKVIGDYLVRLEKDKYHGYVVTVREADVQVSRELVSDPEKAVLTYSNLVLEYQLRAVERRVEELELKVKYQEKE